MQIIRGLHNLTQHKDRAVTIGNFDGVHIAHQKIIIQLVEKSKLMGLSAVLVSFLPTPKNFFGHERTSLSSFRQKHQLLTNLGLDEHLLIRFNTGFHRLSAKDFVQQILVAKLGMKYCLVGDDFHFGRGRQGDFTLLNRLSKKHGFIVENTQSVLCNQRRVSSSAIRKLLAEGRMGDSAQMLGREFSIWGRVIRGQQKGKTIGFPTLNISIKQNISPVLGVFSVQVEIGKMHYYGVCNVGTRPTVGGKKILLEVFLFNFGKTVYGQCVKVVFKHKIRDEQKFASLDRLKSQIQKDVKSAQHYFYD